MNSQNRYVICLCLALIISRFGFSFTVSGKIVDESNLPLSFVTVYVKGSSIVVTSNEEGEYSIELAGGKYEVIFQLTGFKVHSENLNIKDNVNLNIILKEDVFQLQEINVIPGKEDPAYEMIRAAQKKRAYYLNQVDAYSCDVYVKGLQRIKKYPRKILGREISLDNVLDTTTGIAYLSESFSKFYFKKPDKIKETLISSKVSGRNNAFSFNQATDVLFNFYENVIQTGFSQRGLISPISSTCFLTYKYQFSGSFYENGIWVNKIKVTPRRETDPGFTGYIYIADSSSRIYSLDLFVTKQNQIKFVDTLKISQIFLPVNNSVWMPFTSKLSFTFDFFGFRGDGYFHGINSNYVIGPETSKRFFNGEEWHVNDDANKRTMEYWDSLRPIPLTTIEQRDYYRKDSLRKIWDSKWYKDSLDKRSNKFKFINILQGYTYRNSWREFYFRVSPLVTGIMFNTVQGLNISPELTFLKRNRETRKELEVALNPNYGFTSEKLYLTLSTYYLYNPKKIASVYVNGGRQLAQFNQNNPISPFANTVYSLFDKRNYMKLFAKDFFEFRWRYELLNGCLITIGGEIAERTPLKNLSNFTYAKRNYSFSANDPLDPSNTDYSFIKSTKSELNIQLRIRIKQKYYTYPNRKITTGSKFPEFTFTYKKALTGVLNSSVRYDFLSLSISDNFDLKRFGKSQFIVNTGKFFNGKNMNFMDYKHFNGNQTIFSSFALDRFQLLDYYRYSTNDWFIEAWYEHNLSGLLASKIPIIKKVQLEEFLGFRYCRAPLLKDYYELSFGLKYLFVRLDLNFTRFKNNPLYGLRFGLFL
ncbi:MAG: DUF5686 and carboxypeptidase regulatory-like domain-containing protein [Bacteroidota bacterium]